MKNKLIAALAITIAALGITSAPATAAPPEPDNPNARLITFPAHAFPTLYPNVSPEKSDAPKYTGTVLTTAQTRAVRDSGALAIAKTIAPYNYNRMAEIIETKSNEALALNPPGCIRIYYTPSGKDPRFPGFHGAAVLSKFCNPPYLIP